MCVCVCVRACVRACMRACVRSCICVFVCKSAMHYISCNYPQFARAVVYVPSLYVRVYVHSCLLGLRVLVIYTNINKIREKRNMG